MDIASQAQCMTTGHDAGNLKIWTVTPDDLDNVGNLFGKDGKETLIKTMIDPTASVIATSSTNKTVTVYNVKTAQEIAKFCPGEITTAMCVTNDGKRLITTSDKGVIYIWRLPQQVTELII